MAKRNIGVLPMNEKYEIINLSYTDWWLGMCANCGRVIMNVATIKNSKWETFDVWLDCANTLESQEISNYYEFVQNEKEYKHYVRRILLIKKLIKEWKLTKILRIVQVPSWMLSYQFKFWPVMEIWTWNVYPKYRKVFWDFVEQNYKEQIENYN